MSERIHSQPRSDRSESEEVQTMPVSTDENTAAALKEELDDLLDSVEETLEEDAEEFVRSFRQKGGQ